MPLLGTASKIDVDTGFLSLEKTQLHAHCSSTGDLELGIPKTESSTAAAYLRDGFENDEVDFLFKQADDIGVAQDGRASLDPNDFPNFGCWNESVSERHTRFDRSYHSLEILVPQLSHPFPSPSPSEAPLAHLDSANQGGRTSAVNEERAVKSRRAPRKRKISEKSEKFKVPKLTRPLSELTKDYHNLPFRNMEVWVHRSPETRWKEVRKRGGYITRPMNSFMLYRSAYAERTKFWCLQNNHQVVSSMSGVSWPLEPPEVRDKYNELARIERMNHQIAHPGYKFSPSKAQGARKRKIAEEENGRILGELDENLTLDSGDGVVATTSVPAGPGSFCQTPPTEPEKAKRTSRRKAQSSCIVQLPVSSAASSPSTTGTLVYLGLSYDKTEGGPIRSSFSHNNPGKSPPVCMGNANMDGQYYQTVVHASSSIATFPNPMGFAVIEDITIRPTAAPAGARDPLRIQLNSGEMDDNLYSPLQRGFDTSQVDPVLLDCSPSRGNQSSPESTFTPKFYNGQNADEDHVTLGMGQLFEMGPLQQCLGTSNGDSHAIHYDNSLQQAKIDISKLPGYTADMDGYLDNCEPWSITHEDGEFCYDEWLQ